MIDHFFIVGAQRSGTSYLYTLLDVHPEIEMAKPLRPEPKFFLIDSLFEKGLEYYEYCFFKDTTAGTRLRGEKTVSYSESEQAAKRISRCFPEAKILFLLRDPVERAISNYWFSVNNGLETMAMSNAFFQEEQRRLNYDHNRISVSPYAYLMRGRYIDHIAIYERYFPRKNIKLMLYEQLVNSRKVLCDLYSFLNVDPKFIPHSIYQVINQDDKPDFSLSPKLQRYLTDYFAQSNAQLTERFGLDLEEWKYYEPQ